MEECSCKRKQPSGLDLDLGIKRDLGDERFSFRRSRGESKIVIVTPTTKRTTHAAPAFIHFCHLACIVYKYTYIKEYPVVFSLAMKPNLSSHIKRGRQRLPSVPRLIKLSESVFGVLGMNPGPFALTGTNTYVVGTGESRLLIDTGEGDEDYLPNLMEGLKTCGAKRISDIVVTHWHYDHLGGVPSVVKRFETEGNPVRVHKYLPKTKETLFSGEGGRDPYMIWPEEKFEKLRDGQIIRVEGASLRVLFTPGHANDHVALVHEEEKSMFTGDNVLGVGTSVFRNLTTYMDSLEKMRQEVSKGDIRTLYPGHGPVIRDAAPGDTIEAYLSHRKTRIAQVRDALTSDWASAEDITRRVYPSEKYPEHLIRAATSNTVQVLLKLEHDGVAVRRANERDAWRCPPPPSSL